MPQEYLAEHLGIISKPTSRLENGSTMYAISLYKDIAKI